MILADLHAHTNCSHGTASILEMLDAGEKSNLRYMAISEHSPLPPGFLCKLYNSDFEKNFPPLLRKIEQLKKGRPGFLAGLELDWTPGCYSWMRDLVAQMRFDHVLGSLHFLDGKSVGNPASWPADMPRAERFERFQAYYHEMAAMAASGLINIASHPDFIKLRVWDDFQAWLGTSGSEQAIGCALRAMARHGVALEINTAGLRWPFHEFYPCSKILGLARECGVEISFGSDAHRPEDVAAGFAEAENLARKHGYKSYLVFMDRKPRVLEF